MGLELIILLPPPLFLERGNYRGTPPHPDRSQGLLSSFSDPESTSFLLLVLFKFRSASLQQAHPATTDRSPCWMPSMPPGASVFEGTLAVCFMLMNTPSLGKASIWIWPGVTFKHSVFRSSPCSCHSASAVREPASLPLWLVLPRAKASSVLRAYASLYPWHTSDFFSYLEGYPVLGRQHQSPSLLGLSYINP